MTLPHFSKARAILIRVGYKITNIKIAKDVLFDYFIYEFFFIIIFLKYSKTLSI